jgi:hypothetical protein
MPISKYFSGNGDKVMKSMTREYGEKKGKKIFYATANKRKGLRDHVIDLKMAGKLKK